MQELSIQDIQEISGGNPYVIAAGTAFVGKIVGNYVYDAVGGNAGINSFFSGVAGAYYSSISTYGYNPYL